MLNFYRYKEGVLRTKEIYIENSYTICRDKVNKKILFDSELRKIGFELNKMIVAPESYIWMSREIIVPTIYYLLNKGLLGFNTIKRKNPFTGEHDNLSLKCINNKLPDDTSCFFISTNAYGYYFIMQQNKLIYLCDPFAMEELILEEREIKKCRKLLKHIETNIENSRRKEIYEIDNNYGKEIAFIFSGSGYSDFDGNMGLFQPGITKKIANEIINSGVSVIRWETNYLEEEDWIGKNALMFEEKVRRNIEKYEPHKIYFIGHSQGCIFANILSRKFDVSGMIFLCPQIVETKELLLEQLYTKLNSKLTKEQIEEIHIYAKTNNRDRYFEVTKFLGKDCYRLWDMLHVCIYDLLIGIKCPVKLGFADKDLQISSCNISRAIKIFGDKVEIFNNTNHFLQSNNIEGMASYSECYRELDESVKKFIINSIKEF